MRAFLVGEVHQDLRALAGLQVLEDDARRVVLGPSPMSLHVLRAGGADVDLAQRDAGGAGQRARVLERARGGAEAGHGHGDDPLAGQAEQVEGAVAPPAAPAWSRGRRRGRGSPAARRCARGAWPGPRSGWRRSPGSGRRAAAGSAGTKGCGSTGRTRRCGFGGGIGASGDRAGSPAGRSCTASPKDVCLMRSTTSRSTSTSVTIRSPSRGKRSPSARRVAFSATSSWPPNTTSVVDSCTPVFA